MPRRMTTRPRPVKRPGLAAARRAAGHTQESLADKMGVERTTVCRWEAGETAPTPWSRPGLAKLLGISNDHLARLLGEQGSKAISHSAPPGESAIPGTASTMSGDVAEPAHKAFVDARRSFDGPALDYFRLQ